MRALAALFEPIARIAAGGGPMNDQQIQTLIAKLKSLQASLPKGVEIVPVYDRSGLIERAVVEAKAAPLPTQVDLLTDVYVNY